MSLSTRRFNGETFFRESSSVSKADLIAEVKYLAYKKYRIVKAEKGYILFSRIKEEN